MVDYFSKFPLNKKFYDYLKKENVKICLVSPELVKKKYSSKITSLKKQLVKKKIKIDAVCTKFPKTWELNSY